MKIGTETTLLEKFFVISLSLATMLAFGPSGYIMSDMMMTASAQSSDPNTSVTSSSIIPDDYVTEYYSEYPLWGVSLKKLVVIQTVTHLAKPGVIMEVRGDISHYIMGEIDRVMQDLDLPVDWRSDCCTVDVFNQDGAVISQYPLKFIGEQADDGDFVSSFIIEPRLFSEGQIYTIKPGFHFASNVMGAVNPEVFFYMTNPQEAQFIVETPVVFNVVAENRTFDVKMASNSVINDFKFSQSAKKLSFTVEENTSSRDGVAQITIPKEMLSGEIMILVDGEEIPRNKAIVLYPDGQTTYDVEVNYRHDDKHTIEILGTKAIPEFPITGLVLVASMVAVLLIARTKTINYFIKSKIHSVVNSKV